MISYKQDVYRKECFLVGEMLSMEKKSAQFFHSCSLYWGNHTQQHGHICGGGPSQQWAQVTMGHMGANSGLPQALHVLLVTELTLLQVLNLFSKNMHQPDALSLLQSCSPLFLKVVLPGTLQAVTSHFSLDYYAVELYLCLQMFQYGNIFENTHFQWTELFVSDLNSLFFQVALKRDILSSAIPCW